MPVSITNKDSSPFAVTLYHDIYCIGSGQCQCTRKIVANRISSPSGVHKVKKGIRLVPATLDINAVGKQGFRVFNLHEAVLSIPQVQVAEKQRKIQITTTPQEPAAVALDKQDWGRDKKPRSRKRKN